MRPVMTRAELDGHKTGDHGRDWNLSSDGYEDMEVAYKDRWQPVPNWGRDGWDLGEWPYVVIYHRGTDLMLVVEGDHTIYGFGTAEARDAATDYLFLWYAAGKHWAPVSTHQRAMLDTGFPLAIGDKWRGPYTRERSSEPTG